MVAEALERVSGLGRHRNVVGRVSDVQALPFPAGTFDVVIANHMLYHVPDPARETGLFLCRQPQAATA